MAQTNKLKTFNDPIYGFIGTPNEFLYKLIAHPFVQRLRRISQMGLSYLVYPGAHHTRFHHALGSMHLMQRAIHILRYKGAEITIEEEKGLLAAILLHDIGHGPFSHALEHVLIPDKSHEHLSLVFMQFLNEQFDGQLEVAMQIFRGEHPKMFLNQLVSSQLDMDRLDYLKRDSFYTGVTEVNISSERLSAMLNVHDNELVVEEKGLYSVEKFLMARRFMYWQVYLHKTGLVAELLLIKLMKRAKKLLEDGVSIGGSKNLLSFLTKGPNSFETNHLIAFAGLDDIDIMASMKAWQQHDDFVLSNLSQRLLNRDLLKIKIKNAPVDPEKIQPNKNWVKKNYDLSEDDANYFVFAGDISNQAYKSTDQVIKILRKNGKLIDVAKASDHFNIEALSSKVVKYYVCYPKESV
ncbi:MAG: HD domain-containing protein [Croceivirga sp.]